MGADILVKMDSETMASSGDALRTRISLLQRAREGSDPPAWEELLGYYDPFVSRVLGSLGFRGADLDDARQQVSLRLWKGLRTYEREAKRAKFRTWFATLIKNTAFNMIRSKKRQLTGLSLDDVGNGQAELLTEESGVEAMVEEEWQKYVVELALERARDKFSGNAVEVFTLSMKGESVEAIAATLGIKTNTVYILKHRVKTVLMKEIQHLKDDLEDFGSDE